MSDRKLFGLFSLVANDAMPPDQLVVVSGRTAVTRYMAMREAIEEAVELGEIVHVVGIDGVRRVNGRAEG